MNNLQKALRINAIFSGISGISFIFLHGILADLFEIEQSSIFWIVGIALVYFALTIVLEIKKQRKLPVIWIIIQDSIWVIASIFLLLLKPFAISTFGNSAIAIVALIVLFMAINQYKALAQSENKV